MPLAVLHSAQAWAEHLGKSRKRTAVTIGNFDGVHLGHQKIIRGVLERAQQSELMSAVLTFYPHPARVLRPAQAPALLETLAQRLETIEAMGIEAALVIQFDAELARLSPEDFVRRFLVDAMRAEHVLVGANFRFGHHQAGDAKLLADLGGRWKFNADVIPPLVEDGKVVSSTAIRNALRDGNVEHAARMLGHPFSLAGEIKTGTGQGRKLVVPTLNLATEQELLPKDGVYATEAVVEGKIYRAATNVGVRPTFDGARRTVESHLFDFSGDLTSGKLEVHFRKRLRDEQKFSGPTDLRAQILRDIEQSKEYFREAASKTA